MSRYTRKAHRRRAGVALNLAAMVDVVFLLLIFFMCAHQWRVPEGALPANIPTGTGQEPQAPERLRDLPPIHIRLTGSGDAVEIFCQERPAADLETLTAQLVQLAGIDRSVPVIIDAQGPVAFRWVIRALNACLKADLANVAFTAPARGVVR